MWFLDANRAVQFGIHGFVKCVVLLTVHNICYDIVGNVETPDDTILWLLLHNFIYRIIGRSTVSVDQKLNSLSTCAAD